MNDSASMRIRIDAEVSSAVQGLQQVSKNLDALVPGGKTVSQVLQRIQFGLLQIVQGTARNAFVSITSGLSNMVDAGMQVAETMEAAAVGFESILAPGQDVNALLLDIQKNAIKTPFDVDDLTASTQKLALITKNGALAEQTVLDLGAAVAAAGRGNAELNRMAINMQQIGLNSKATARDIREFGNAGIGIIDMIAEYSKAFKETGKDASEVMDWLESISNPYEVIAEVLHKAADEGGRFADIYEKGATTIKQANENMQDSIAVFSYRVLEQSTILDKAKNVFSEFQNSLFLDESFTANTAAAIQHVIDMINELDIIRPIIEGIKKAMSAFANGQFDNIIVFFKELFNALKQFSGIKVIINLFEVLLDLFSNNHTAEEVGNVARQIGELVRAFLELKFALNVATYVANFAGAFMKIGYALKDMIPGIAKAVSGFSSLISSGGKWVVVAAAVVAAIVLVQKYGKQIGEIFGKVGETLAGVGQALGNAVKEIVTVGYNLMVGLWNGIVEGAQEVFKGIQNIGRSIINGFKAVFGIHSPSTVMRDTIGRNISLGIAEGIKQNYGEIAKVEKDVLNELVKLQSQYVKELGDFGALDLVETVKVYKEFAALYQQGTKARIEMDEKVHDSQMSIVKEMISLIETYNKQWDKSFTKAKDYYDMFEYTQNTLTRSTKSVIEGLTRQNNNLTKYYDNLKKMSEMGFDADFMQYIYDQGLDAAEEVNGLADATQEEIEKINELWATRGKVAADIATLNTKQLKEDTLEELEYLEQGLDTKVLDYYEDGAKLAYNFAEGIYAMMPTIEQAMAVVEANTKEKSKKASESLGKVATDYANGWNDAIAGIDTSPFKTQLEDLEIKMFDTKDALSLLKNMLAGIPWYVWAIAVAAVAAKLKGLWTDLTGVGSTAKAVKSGFGGMAETLGSQFTSLTAQISRVVTAIERVQAAIYNVSNYNSVFRQAMSGMYPTVNAEVEKIINLIDLAKSQGVITTQEATKLIGDIITNGVGNISQESQETFTKMQSMMGETVTNTAQIVESSIENLEQGATASIQRLESGMKALPSGLSDDMSKELGKTTQVAETATERIQSTFINTKDGVVEVMGDIPDGISDAYDDVMEATIVTTENMGSRWTRLGDKLRSGASGISNIFGTLGTVIQGINPTVATGLTQISDTISSGLFKLESTGITRIGGLVDNFKTNFGRFKEVGTNAKTELGKIGDGMKESFDQMKGVASDGFDQMKNAMDTKIVQTSSSVKTKVTGMFSTATNGIVEFLSGLGNVIAAPIQGLGNIIVSLLNALGGLIKGAISSLLETIGGIINAFFQTIMTLIKTLMGGIGEALAALLKPLSDPKLLLGVVAIGGLALALVAIASACSIFSNVNWGDMAKAGVAMVALGVVAAAFGAAAQYIVVGAIAIAAAGAALLVAGLGIKVFTECIQQASEIGTQINLAGLGLLSAAILAIGAVLTAGVGLTIIGAISGLAGVLMAGELVLIAGAFVNASQMAAGIDLGALSYIALATDIVGAFLAAGAISNIIGAISGLAGVLMAGELLVITLAFEEASKHAGNIDLGALGYASLAVDIVGAMLTAGTITNIIGALSGAFATLMSGEMLVIVLALEEASKHAQNIDALALEGVALALDIIGVTFTAGLVSNLLGAVSAAFAAMISGELIVITAALAKATTLAKDIDADGMKKVQEAIDSLKEIDFGGAFSNLGKMASAAELAGTAAAVALMVENVIKICNNLKELEGVAGSGEGEIEQRLELVKTVVNKVSEFGTGDWMKALGQNWETGNLKEVADNVNEIIEAVANILDNLKYVNKLAGGEDQVETQLGKVVAIVDKVGKFISNEDGSLTTVFKWGDKRVDTTEKLGEMAENVSKVIEAVKNILDNLNKIEDLAGKDQEVLDRIATVGTIITDVSKLVDGSASMGGGWFSDSKDETAGKIGALAESVAKTIEQVIKMVENLKELEGAGVNQDNVAKKVEEIGKIVSEFSKIGIDDGGNDLSEVKDQATKIAEFTESFDKILGSVKNMVDTVKAIQEMGYNPQQTTELVSNIEGIIQKLASIKIDGQKDDEDLSGLAGKASNLQNATESYNSILGSTREMVDKLVKFKTDGYNFGEEGGDDKKNVTELVKLLNQIIAELGKVVIGAAVKDLEDLSNRSSKLKEASSNLNDIITTVTEMVNNLTTFKDTVTNKKTSVETMVEDINDILKKLLGDKNGEGGIKFPSTADIGEDSVAALNNVNEAVKKIGEISASLLTIQDASDAVLNAQTIVSFITDTMAKLPEALGSFESDMKLQGEAYAQAFLNGWKSKIPEATSLGHEMQGALWTAIEGKMQDEYWQGAALGGKVIDGLRSKTNEFSTVALEHQKKYWDTVESKMGEAKQQGEKLGKQVLEGIRSTTDSFRQAGEEAQGTFWRALESKMQDEYWQGAALAGKVYDGMVSKKPEIESAGKFVTQGFSSGMSAEIWRINTACGQISDAAVNKLRELLRIASPSKVMAELGSYVTIGFAEGITDDLNEIERAGEKLAEAVMDGYNDTIEPLSIAGWEARNMATEAGMGAYGDGGSSVRNTTINQTNQIYNDMDASKALSDIAWAISRS